MLAILGNYSYLCSINRNISHTTMKQRVLSLFIALLGIATGAQAQSVNMVYVGSQPLSDGTYTSDDLTDLTEGTITYDSSQKLVTLNNAVVNNTSGNGIQITVSELTVKTIGECIITASQFGLDLHTSITIDGNGSSTANKLEITSSEKSGIHLYSGNCTLTICNNANVSAEGMEYGICGNSSNPSKLAMTGKYTQLWFKGSTACIKDIDLSDGPLNNGFAIYYPVGTTYQASTNTIVDAGSNEVKDKWVLFQEGIGIYGLNFPDENFRNWLLAQDYGKKGYLTDEDIEEVTSINVSDEGIVNLQGIGFFKALTFLNCNNNSLTALDLSKNTALETLDCSDNNLTALDLSKNTALETLDCSENNLTALDVSKNTKLTSLDCYQNCIRDVNMTALVNSLPDIINGPLHIYKNETPAGNEIYTLQAKIATSKNWQVMIHDGTNWVEYAGETVDFILGDANDNKKVDAADIVAVVNHIKGIPLDNFNNLAADMNYDGKVNYADIEKIKNIIMGLDRPAATATAEDLGKLICTAGHIHAYGSDDGCTADRVAMIIFVGEFTGNSTYKNGLALALTDESGTMDWSTAKTTVEAHSPTVVNAEWMLPDWEHLVKAAGDAKKLRESFSSVGGTNIQVGYYWDKEEWGTNLVECYIFYEDYTSAGLSGSPFLDQKTSLYNTRACLAF